MTIQMILDLPNEDVVAMSDAVLTGHLMKYFPQTRPLKTMEAEEDDDLPDFIKEAVEKERAENQIAL